MLMVTGRNVKEDIIAAIEAGVNGYIANPFTPQMLKDKIDAVVASHSTAH